MHRIEFSYAPQVVNPYARFIVRMVESLTSRARLKRLYLHNQESPRLGESFWSAAVRLLRLNIKFDRHALNSAPAKGPLVAIANHPYGALDGITLAWLLEKIRPDVKIMVSSILEPVPELAPFIIPVDLSDRPEAIQRNIEARRTAMKHVSDGGALIVFPAGLIAISPDRWGRSMAVDPEWRTFSAQLIRRTGADVLPVFFFGQNSRLFQFASHISRTLKLALIFHEVARRTGSVVEVGIGSVISAQEIQAGGNNAQLIRDLRRRTYEIGAKGLRDRPLE